MGGEVLEHHQVDCDDDCEPNCEHDVSEGKKAEKDFDGDGKLESPESEYKGSKDKAIKKELKDLSKAAKTLKGKNVAKADEVEEDVNLFRRFRGIDEAKRDLADRLHRKRKLYDRTVPKAMEYARREGEAAGHARYRMGQLDREMDKVKDKMKEKDKK